MGRINRITFFVSILSMSLITVLFLIFIRVYVDTDPFELDYRLMYPIYFLIFIVVLIQIIKRLHDINLSGWFSILFLIPYLNFILILLLFLIDGTIGTNKYGADSKKRTLQNFKTTDLDKFDKTVLETSNKTAEFLKLNTNKAMKFAEKKISTSYLTNCTWQLMNEREENILYIFRNNNELLISNNGIIERAIFEYIVDNNSILITQNAITELYFIVLVKDDFLFLNKTSTNKLLYFANQTKFKDWLKSEILKRVEQIIKEYNL